MKTYKFIIILIAFFTGCLSEQTNSKYEATYFKGVSNNGQTGDKPYLTAGDKANIIGLQDGSFPDMGGHVPGEMGGVWTLPIKLADGYWLKLTDTETKEEQWLMKADTFVNYPYGNQFIYNPVINGIQVTRTQFAPERKRGVVISYTLQNTTPVTREIEVDFTLKSDVSPVWISNENGIYDGKDEIRWDTYHNLFHAIDKENNWHAVWGTDQEIVQYVENSYCPVNTKGQGAAGNITGRLELKPGNKKEITYIICGSQNSFEEAVSVYKDIAKNKETLLKEKKDLYSSLLKRTQLNIPDKKLQETYNWVKINTQWLVSDLDGIGRFLGAGAIEYPWLFGCDNSYALQGVLASGDFELAKSTLLLLKEVSEKVNGNGRIIHEMSSNGFVGNKGNTQETAHFIVAAWKTFEWTGDIKFLQELYPYIKKGIHWLTVEMDKNNNLFPEGYGIMEVKGLNAELIDVAVYTQQALEATARMADLFNEKEEATAYREKAEQVKQKINTLFWDEDEGSYCDFYGTREQAISTVQGAIEQLKTGNREQENSFVQEKIRFYQSLMEKFTGLPAGTEQGWFTNKNWVINTPMETGIAPPEKAIRNLNKIRNEHCGEYGPFLSAVEKKHMMTISTGVQAMSEARYGRTDEMMGYMNCIVKTLHRTLPGSINEMMPDYGCPVQAWTIYGIATPVITHIFGVTPDAYNKKVEFKPNLPSGWEYAEITDVYVGDNLFSINISKKENETTYFIRIKDNSWDCHLSLPGDNIPLTEKENSITLKTR